MPRSPIPPPAPKPSTRWTAIVNGSTIPGQVLAAVFGAVVTGIGGYLLTQLAGGWLIHQLGGVTLADVQSEIAKHPSPPGLKGDKGDRGPPGELAGLVSGAVVAFDIPGGCPEGWLNFEPATSRAIIGAVASHASVMSTNDKNGKSLTARPYRSDGGEEEHLLTIAEMPKHSHTFEGPRLNASGVFGGKQIEGAFQKVTSSTSAVGGDQPFNIMPPFVALFYCKKTSQ